MVGLAAYTYCQLTFTKQVQSFTELQLSFNSIQSFRTNTVAFNSFKPGVPFMGHRQTA